MITVGIDIGSLAAKAVLLNGNTIQGVMIQPTGWQPKSTAEKIYHEVIRQAGYKPQDVKYIVGTGYGRICLTFIHEAVTEITCHAKGAYFVIPRTQLVIDIGGQDSKVIRVGPRGRVEDFAMNDKCAAGTGRFLEVMATALGTNVDEMGDIALDSEPVSISSMCTVFAESEIISLLAGGTPRERIIAGLHHSIAERVARMASPMLPANEIIFTGGVANNRGIKRAIENSIGVNLCLPPNPQIIGALGAALLGQQRIKESR
jgi:predicted CoA-substrate-specific enzyme activase